MIESGFLTPHGVLLTSVVAALRTRVTIRVLTWVNRISGAVILAFAIAAIVSSLAT